MTIAITIILALAICKRAYILGPLQISPFTVWVWASAH